MGFGQEVLMTNAERGKPLSFDTFNLYHADEWIIRPATAAVPGSSHGTSCSYVELLGNKFDLDVS